MLRDQIEVTVKWRGAFSLKNKNLGNWLKQSYKHFESEASCQLAALLLVIYTFILNIYFADDKYYYNSERHTKNK